MSRDLHLRVWRGDASGGEFQSYTVPVEDGEVVLDAIHRLQATQAFDLAVRWNCKAGKCGSCSAEINGKPGLMCLTRLSTFDDAETITVNPMRTFPIIRDLVTDVTFNYEKAREVPSFAPAGDNSGGKFRMAQVDVERSQEFRKCIECFLCQNTCHVIRDHEENKPAFAGPRFFIRLAELDMHPLDTVDRKQMAQQEEGLGYCNITKCCTEVCPEGIHITDNAIIPMKERVVDTKYDPIMFLGSKIGRRREERPAVSSARSSGPSPIKRPAAPAVAAASVAVSGDVRGSDAKITTAPTGNGELLAAVPKVATAAPIAKAASGIKSAAAQAGSAAAAAPAAAAHGVTHGVSSAAHGVSSAAHSTGDRLNSPAVRSNAVPAATAVAGLGLLAWALRKARRT